MAHRLRELASPRANSKGSRRSRGFGGCAACRRKRIKCDERRPKCSVCAANASLCTYEKHLFFDLDDHSGSGGRHRRPILTEDERKLMTQSLTASLGLDSALDLVTAIDIECEATSPPQDFQIRRGPFGAFRPSQAVTGVQFDRLEGPKGSTADFNAAEVAFYGDQIASPNTLALLDKLFEQSQEIGTQSGSLDTLDFFADGCRIREMFDDLPTPEMQQLPLQFPSIDGSGSSQAAHHDLYRTLSPSIANGFATSKTDTLPNEAVPLLKHYQATVLRSLTPFRHSKTPWHVLFLPQAKNCLAALTLGDTIDSATLCSFYGTLAISAFSLSGVSSSKSWEDSAQAYKEQARQYIRITLKTAYEIPKRAKYKAILIALLTMVQLSVVSGNLEQTETYFLEAEKFIRLRGLSKRKSRKVCMLHHCYAFERILYESTLRIGPSADHRQHVRKAIETSGTVIIGQDALSFRLGRWNDLEREILRVKCQDEGENDLHLQNPAFWPASLYPEIFGVPEQTLVMVSLILRLAKEKENDGQGIGLRLNEFLERAKAIEKLIHQLERPVLGSDIDNLQEAMHLALLIYFYRRIYDVESSLLQDKVLDVLSCLIRSSTTQSKDTFGIARFNWPASIAACEADDLEAQASFSAWFKGAAEQTGLNLFTTSLTKAEKTWEARRGVPTY